MTKKISLLMVAIVVVSSMLVSTVFAATIDPVNRTITTSNLFVDWSESNPEEIVDLRWMGSANLTNTASNSNCAGDLEYFGNSWVTENEGDPFVFFGSLVGWGTSGTWQTPNSKKVNVDSISLGCYGSADIPVSTNYQFFDGGPTANRFKVQRKFDFGMTAYAHDIRPYIPRLYPQDGFTQVLHPDSSGTIIITETLDGCDFGCAVTDWNGSWFAIHDPVRGTGLIVKHEPSSYLVTLWVDKDDASFTNASSVLLLQPTGGFIGNVTETELFCFYNSSTWAPSTTLPSGC